MTAQSRPHRYTTLSIALHWGMLLLLAAVYAAMELREIYPRGSDPREAMKLWHFMLGLSVLGLVVLRLAARLLWPAPAPLDEPVWRNLAAKAVHLGLYGLMIGMPIAGWVILSAEGKGIPFFGLELPPLTGKNDALAEQIEELHELGGTIGYWLIGIHAAAALFHHYVVKDRLLARMIPSRR